MRDGRNPAPAPASDLPGPPRAAYSAALVRDSLSGLLKYRDDIVRAAAELALDAM
ncbi:hypothetical protein [Streptomyces sp. NPDC048577]|uniref:hypothetical protein n=1 Tax=Streptomyces sp. NPDC048577 TaxID=3157209 RepID=UPI00343B7FA0